MNRTIRSLLGVTATAGLLALGVPALSAAANASTTSTAGITSATFEGLRQAQPFLFTYTFNGHLKVAGGNFTVNRRVYLAVKFTTGRVAFAKWEIARPHPITPGGAIYVETTIAAPCSGFKNGYARAYDEATKTWSPQLPVEICQRID
ncbi:hypothetical protein [Nonomuraea guangzhouensis]|uniref:Uncharacterized protein n=1 Tax=Nonomuraea guangzhouensis TaxID=1291555 RepID=A0ABW4FZJ5_9ACTN|nr:hypothetical protein [Nonomuraea guangzhouensis]